MYLRRYIEIFRSSLSEINSALGYGPRASPPLRGPPFPFGSRPGPYDRTDRFGGGGGGGYGGGGGGGRFPARGSRSFKGANFSNNISKYFFNLRSLLLVILRY